MPRNKNNFQKNSINKDRNISSDPDKTVDKQENFDKPIHFFFNIITVMNCFIYTFLVELSKSKTLKFLVTSLKNNDKLKSSTNTKELQKFIRHPFWLIFIILSKSIRNIFIGILIAGWMPFYSHILFNSIMALGNYTLLKNIEY